MAPQVRGGVGRVARRRKRCTLAGWQHRHSTLDRVRECGNLVRQLCEVVVRGDVAHYAGLRSCGSPWACTCCAVKIAAGRIDEIAEAVRRARADGCTILFLTLTFAHHRGQALAQLLDAQQRAWALFRQGRGWRRFKGAHDVEFVRTREATEGENGWHPHYHAALFVRGHVQVDELVAELRGQWLRALRSAGLSGSVAHALDLVEWDDGSAAEDLGGYLAKQLGLEVAGGPVKEGREGRRTPFAILEGAADGEVDAIALWREWEQATFGKRSVFWSARCRYRPRVEQTDDELAAAEVGGDFLLGFDGAVKRAVFEASPRGVELLELAEVDPDLALAYVSYHAPPGGQVFYRERREGVIHDARLL